MGQSRRERSAELRNRALAEAEPSDGVLSRAQLREIGVGRDRVAGHVRAGRWTTHGRQTIALHTGRLSPIAQAWRAVHESGGDARVDGVTALRRAGVTGLSDETVHISVHHLCQVRDIEGVRQHKVSRRVPARRPCRDSPEHHRPWPRCEQRSGRFRTGRPPSSSSCRRSSASPPRTTSGRCTSTTWAGDVAVSSPASSTTSPTARSHWESWTSFPHSVDVVCRPPTRQAMRRVDGRTRHLDVLWEDIGLALEIDGAAHAEGVNLTFDHLRQNAITIGGELILRMNLIGLRLEREAFLDQVVEAHRLLSAQRDRPR